MTPGLELLLVAGTFAFYLQDSMLLLHYDELAFTRAGTGWRVSAGDSQWGGRFLFLPNALLPARPLFRASWLPRAERPAPTQEGFDCFLRALGRFRFATRLLWLQLLVALPLLLWAYPLPLAMLGLLAGIYATIAVIAVRLWRQRRVLGLQRVDIAALVFGCLACPPHAINIIRRLGLRQALPTGTLEFARSMLPPAAFARLGDVVRSRIDLVEGCQDADDATGRLLEVRQRLQEPAR